MQTDQYYIEQSIIEDPIAQTRLFKKYFSRMYHICLRFAKSATDAEDILQEGFIKVFANLNSFRNEGTFENWMKRIMINTSFNYYKRKYPNFNDVDFEKLESPRYKKQNILEVMSENEILDLVDELPEGYKTVFNLSAIQGYTHREIGQMLNISKNTSKSQLNRAKTSLREKIRVLFQVEDLTSYYDN